MRQLCNHVTGSLECSALVWVDQVVCICSYIALWQARNEAIKLARKRTFMHLEDYEFYRIQNSLSVRGYFNGMHSTQGRKLSVCASPQVQVQVATPQAPRKQRLIAKLPRPLSVASTPLFHLTPLHLLATPPWFVRITTSTLFGCKEQTRNAEHLHAASASNHSALLFFVPLSFIGC